MRRLQIGFVVLIGVLCACGAETQDQAVPRDATSESSTTPSPTTQKRPRPSEPAITTAAPSRKPKRRSTAVAPDLRRLADAFVAYARGETDTFPHWESVSLGIGGETAVAVDDIGAALPNRDVWKTCPPDWTWYGAGSCPVDLLGPIKAAAVNGTELVYSSQDLEVTCAPPRSGPLPAGRAVIIRPSAPRRTCANDFALALVADDDGLLRSVDLTLAAP